MPKHIATATLEGTRKSRPRKRWGDEAEGEINIIGIKTGRQWPENVGLEEYSMRNQGPLRNVALKKKRKKKKKDEEGEEEEKKKKQYQRMVMT